MFYFLRVVLMSCIYISAYFSFLNGKLTCLFIFFDIKFIFIVKKYEKEDSILFLFYFLE